MIGLMQKQGQQAGGQPRSDREITEAPLNMEGIRPASSGAWSTKEDPGAPQARQQAQQQGPEAGQQGVQQAQQWGPQSRQIIRDLEAALREPQCTQIDGYGPGQITIQYRGENQVLEGKAFDNPEEYLLWIRSQVENSNSVVTWEQVERDKMAVLELHGGERLCIFLPPIARPYPTFSLRKHTAVDWPSAKLIELGTLNKKIHEFLLSCVAARVNILFVGAMGGGKTSALRAFLQDGAGDDERIAIVEQVPELSIRKPLVMHQLYLPTVEGFQLSDVLDYNLYNGLDRLIVGEVHMEGITKMLEAMIVTEGSMSTYHAYTTAEAAERMKLALQLENPSVTAETAASYIRQAVELVVVIQKIGDRRVITEITEIDWRTSTGDQALGGRLLFKWDHDRGIHVGSGNPPDARGRIANKFVKYGLAMNRNWFIEKEHIEAGNFR